MVQTRLLILIYPHLWTPPWMPPDGCNPLRLPSTVSVYIAPSMKTDWSIMNRGCQHGNARDKPLLRRKWLPETTCIMHWERQCLIARQAHDASWLVTFESLWCGNTMSHCWCLRSAGFLQKPGQRGKDRNSISMPDAFRVHWSLHKVPKGSRQWPKSWPYSCLHPSGGLLSQSIPTLSTSGWKVSIPRTLQT